MPKTAPQKKRKVLHAKRKEKITVKSLFQFFVMIPVLFICLFVYLLISSRASAAVGLNRVINFQGRIVNKSDSTNITSQNYSFTFKLYDASTNGNLLWQETQSSVAVTNGIFQVSLGSVTPFNGGGYNVDFKQNNLWLDITFNGETFGSRIQLAAVPQAIDAEQLSGVVATQSANTFTLTGGTSTPVTVTFPTSSTTVAGLSLAQTFTAAQTIQSNSSAALTVGANGGVNPVLQVDASTGSVATGLSIAGAATGGTTALTVTDSGSSAGLSIDAKGSGAITLGGNSTGSISIGTSTTGKTIQIGNSGSTADTIILGNSSDTALKLAKFGTQNGVLYVSATDGTVSETAASTGTQCLVTTSSGVAPTWGSCSGSTSLQSVYNIGQTIDFSQVSNTAGLTIGTATGVGNILLQPNAGGAAAVVINKQNSVGDIFTASASGSTKFVLSQAGNLGLGTNTPQQALTLGSSNTFATEMAAPSGVSTGAPTSGGSLTKNTAVFYKITATDGVGETIGSTESNSCTPAGSTQTCPISWTGVPNAVAYKIYRTTTSGSYSGTNYVTSVTTTSYTDTGAIALTSGTPPTVTTAYINKFSASGASWLLGGNVGIGTATPIAPVDIEDGNSGGNAALIINQTGANTNDILTASAAGSTKFIVHNDGSIQTIGGNATADITSITAGNGLTILPKANGAGAGGGLTLKGGNGSTTAGGVTIDTGTGSSGTISIGASNATGITLGTATTITTGGLTVSAGNVAITAGALTLGGTTRISNAGVGTFVANTVVGTDTFTANTITDSGGLTLATATSSNGNITLTPNGTGDIILTSTPVSGVKIGASGNLLSVLSVSGGVSNTAAFIVNNTNSGDLITASASSTPKFIVHNDGSIQTIGGNATADITSITAGNGLTILPKANGAGAGGGLTLKGGNGSGAAGGGLTLDAGTGSTNGTISLGTTTQSGITIGRSGAATTINGSSLTLGGATGVSGALTVTSNSSSGLTVGANGSVNPVFTVDASTTSVATGLKVLGAATGGTTAVSVTDSGSNANLSLDAKGSGTITIGGTSTGNIILGGSNGLTISSTGPSYTGNAKPAKQIVLSAEYAGAVLTASGSANISGNMTSDASPSATPTSYDWENYYMWSAQSNTSPTLQTYTVAVRVTLPKDFSAWATGNCFTVAFNTPFISNTLNGLDVYLYQNSDTTGTPIAFRTNQVSTISKNWTTVNFTSTDFGGAKAWNTAGSTAVMYLNLKSANTPNYVQVGDITLNYLAAF